MAFLIRHYRSFVTLTLGLSLILLGLISMGPTAASAQETTEVAAVDGTPPVISILPDIVAPAADASGAVVTYLLPATSDDVDGPLTPSCLPASGVLFPLGVTPITCTAIDRAGNQTSVVAFNIIVKDLQGPFIEQPGNIALVASDATGMVVSFGIPAASDNVSGPVPVGCTPGSGAWFPIGSTVVTCSAADGAGNVSAVSFTVTLEAPVIPTEEPTQVPTEEPTPVETETPEETPTATEPGEDPTGTPGGENPDGSATATPSATASPTPSPSPTPVTTPAALPLPSVLPPPANPIYGSGPIDGLSLIWGGLSFPISQEYGHTDFSLAQETLYLYGLGLGLDGRAHPGLDIGMPAGTYLYSPVDGTVIVSGGVPYYTYYGNGQPGVGELLIETDSGDQVILGHMAAIAVSAGQRVTTGQFVGLSGGENGDHLHLETRSYGILAVDPRKSFLVDSLAAYNGFDATPSEPDSAGVPDETTQASAEPESAPADEGAAVTNQSEDQGAAVTSEPPNLLNDLQEDSPFGDQKTELIGELLGTRSVTANQQGDSS